VSICAIAPAWASLGGISGGGGNVIISQMPTQSLDPEYVKHTVRNLKSSVVLFLQQKEQMFENGEMADDEAFIYQPLFEKMSSVAEALNPIPVYVDDKNPCFDQSGQKFDGSTLAPKANMVCISAKRIARKLEQDDLTPQTSALLVHEFSEKFGLTDDEAIQIQTRVLAELRKGK
jgi:hypothetical protein